MRIVWRRRALIDLNGIEAFIENDNPAAARAMEQRIKEAVSLLAVHPGMGRPGRVPNTRELIVADTPYIVAYMILRDHIEILTVLHSAREWPDAL
ncbi:MAG: type II toxin-antitoxin system RelE/ParE family toxin [Alphaproteobacteria bacterium]